MNITRERGRLDWLASPLLASCHDHFMHYLCLPDWDVRSWVRVVLLSLLDVVITRLSRFYLSFSTCCLVIGHRPNRVVYRSKKKKYFE